MRTLLLSPVLLAACTLTAALARAEEKSAVFFNGKDLTGWEGLSEYWSHKDGAIVGYTAKDPKFNTFLCTKKSYKNFEMKFQVRLKDGIGNSGVQIRSEVFEPKRSRVKGPQCDIGKGYWGSLYNEGPGGRMMKAAPPDVIKKVVKDDDFNDYYIQVVGKHVTIKVNDATMVDGDFEKMPEDGIIALQLHGGYPSMEVIFKNIQFKELKAEK